MKNITALLWFSAVFPCKNIFNPWRFPCVLHKIRPISAGSPQARRNMRRRNLFTGVPHPSVWPSARMPDRAAARPTLNSIPHARYKNNGSTAQKDNHLNGNPTRGDQTRLPVAFQTGAHWQVARPPPQETSARLQRGATPFIRLQPASLFPTDSGAFTRVPLQPD